jgi:hypothetical protein
MRDSCAGISHSLPQIMGVDGAGVIEEADSGALIGRHRSAAVRARAAGTAAVGLLKRLVDD